MNKILRAVSLSAALCSTPAMAEAESWYAYWGIGVAANAYPATVEAAFRQADNIPGASRAALSMEAFGFYWPLAEGHTLIGAVLDVSSDSVTLADDVTEAVVLDQALYAFSVMHFWGDEPGTGFFVRGDLGPARFDFSSTDGPPASGTGFGLLIGTGYGIAASEGSRLILNLTYSNKLLEGEAYSTAACNVAFLW